MRLDVVTAPTDDVAVRIYVGESEHASQAGVTAKGLKRDALKIASGENWLALVGNDLEFERLSGLGMCVLDRIDTNSRPEFLG